MDSTIDTTPTIYTPKMNVDTRMYSDHGMFDMLHGTICPCTP